MKKWYSKNDIKQTAKTSIWGAYGPKVDPKSGPTRGGQEGTTNTLFRVWRPSGQLWGAIRSQDPPKEPPRHLKMTIFIHLWTKI